NDLLGIGDQVGRGRAYEPQSLTLLVDPLRQLVHLGLVHGTPSPDAVRGAMPHDILVRKVVMAGPWTRCGPRPPLGASPRAWRAPPSPRRMPAAHPRRRPVPG